MAALNTTSVDIPRAHQPSIGEQFLSTSERFLLNPAPSGGARSAAGADLNWLLRYARCYQVKLNAQQSEANALRSCFTQAAWRLVCRSDRNSFIPILRNRQLSFDSLLTYTQALVENGFQLAPCAEHLDYLIQSSYYFFDRMPSVPDSKVDMTLLRLANRRGGVTRADFQKVDEWAASSRVSVSTRMTWPAVLRRASDWHQRQKLVVECAKATDNSIDTRGGWHFACTELSWRGYAITPLANDIDLWDEGQAMSSCLYRLRHLCGPLDVPSRYFSVRKNGNRFATLELVRDAPSAGMTGPDRIYGRWRLQDCRLSNNRLPSEDLVKKLTDFGWHYNVLSQRPGRIAFKPPHSPRAGKKVRTLPTEEQIGAIKEWLGDQLHRDTADLVEVQSCL